MLYSILIFGVEGVAEALPEADHAALLEKHKTLRARLEAEGTYRGSVQLMAPSSASHIVEKNSKTIVMDGPFAESKEQFLGFYLVECDDIGYALQAAAELPQGIAHMEVRAVKWSGGL